MRYKKDCEVLVKMLLKGMLHLHDARNILFDRTQRVGQKIEQDSPNRLDFTEKGKSTTDCVFILHSIISEVLNSGENCFVYS